MDIIVIGLGSMGKRRIRLMREMYPDYVVCGVDSREDRREEVKEKFGIDAYSSIEAASEAASFDCAFVCTSPLAHNAVIRECLTNGWNVFTEMNLVSDGYDENMKLAKDKNLCLFLSSTFLYREEIRYIQKKVSGNAGWNYVYHIGQYLPDWHPWENYNDFFIGDRRTNGCREILAIELPWLVAAFGAVTGSSVVSDKITALNIDYDDNYMIQLSHENGNKGVLVADVVSPCAVRRLEVYGEKRYLQWSGTPDSLCEYDSADGQLKRVSLNEQAEHQDGYSAFVVENAYKNEIRAFFDAVTTSKSPIYGFEQDMKVLQLIDKLEGK